MRKLPGIFAFATALLLVSGVAAAQAYDPPQGVARLSYAEGDVSFSPAGEQQWLGVHRNRPHSRGDRFWTNDRSRAELQFGIAVLRMDERTSLGILNLDDRYAQFELTQGTVNLSVRRLFQGQTYEIATPTLAFVVNEPGEYRIDVDERGGWTEVVMWDGSAIAYGDQSQFPLRAGDAIRFVEPTLRDYTVFRFPEPDGFDQFAQLRNESLERSQSLRYVPDNMIGYSDLDEYGSWSNVSGYGNVWFPTQVNAGWAPYRQGNWIWQDPWGWTWVDQSEWGFAPFHYGRWVNLDQRWGWIPTSRRTSAIYAPALVAFLGTGSAYSSRSPIGWFPLGPRDVYLPSYSASRDYFTRINSGYATINVATINNTYTSYASGLRRPQLDYMYRSNRNAVTAVPADVFVGSRPVAAAVIPYDRSASAFSEATHIARMAPTVQSVTGASRRASAIPNRALASRRVIARTAPPPPPVSFEARRQHLGRDPGRPMDPAAMETLRGQGRGRGADAATRQVRVVGAGTPVQRQQNEARTATRELERVRDPNDAGNRGRSPEQGSQGRYARDRDPAPAEQAGDSGRAAREAQRQAEDAGRARQQAEQEQARDQRQEVQRQQRDAEQATRRLQQEREQSERAAGEQRRAEQEAQQAQREQQRQQREAEQAQRQARQALEQQQGDASREQQRQAQEAQREQQRQQREAEQAQRQAQQQQQQAEQAARAQQEAERQEQAAQREQQRQQREAEQAERRVQQEQQQAAQRAQREQQQAAQQAQREQQAAQQAQRQQQQAAQQAEREQQQAAQRAQQAQQQAEAAQRQAEHAQQPAEAAEEEEEEGKGKGRYKRGRDGG